MINNIKIFGKYLDQPMLISKLNKQMPKILTGLGAVYFAKITYDCFQKRNTSAKHENRHKNGELFNKAIVLASSIASALAAPAIAGKITKRIPVESIDIIKGRNTKLIDKYLSRNVCDESCRNILNKAKENVLNYGEVKELAAKFTNRTQKNFLKKLIPNPQNIKAKDIFHEIGYLSVYGAIPVLGGITGGIAADAMQGRNLKKTVPDKINEGIYQYLANIFMCNIGAGAALGILEKKNITSKFARAIGMTAGIILTGVAGGSKIANLITKYVISPVLDPQKKHIKERNPEALDLGLHMDDIATVSLLSGLKWIEPALPVLYSVSGYRSGIGYRN